jgi:hypothetical protein
MVQAGAGLRMDRSPVAVTGQRMTVTPDFDADMPGTHADLDIDSLGEANDFVKISCLGLGAGDHQTGHGDDNDREFACEIHDGPFRGSSEFRCDSC